MHSQDNKINYRIIVSALIAVILAILIAFYYSYAQSKNRIVYFQEQVSLLEKDLTLLQVEVDHLGGLNEVSTIELDESKFKIQNLLDSIGQLTFTVEKYKEYKREIRILEAEFDTIKYKYAKLSQ